ncbi:MAG TPA: hypothetical protein VG821_11245 [Rhizomicrobium sp.]|nr:hypothetical protein [Rhizomicrobium sp.]
MKVLGLPTNADEVFTFFTWVGVLALGAGVISAVAIAISGTIRDDRLRSELSASSERVANAELKTEQLRKQLGPRHLQRDIFLREIKEAPPSPVEIMYLRDDPECFDLAQQIWRVLEDAKWPVSAPVPIPKSDDKVPSAMVVAGQPSGVTVATHSVSFEEVNAGQNQMMGHAWVRTPWTVLMKALADSLGKIGGSGGGLNGPPEGTLRVVVAPR